MLESVQALESVKPFYNTPIPIGAAAFQYPASRPDHEVFSIYLKDLKHVLKSKIKTDPAIILPKTYKKFLKVFSLEETNKLSPAHSRVIYFTKLDIIAAFM